MNARNAIFAVTALAGWLATSAPAHAGGINVPPTCAMPELPVSGPPDARLVRAENDIRTGYGYSADRVVRTVLDMSEATAAQKGEAHAIAGLVMWTNGNHRGARAEFQEARSLDAASIPKVLALSTDKRIAGELKKALGV